MSCGPSPPESFRLDDAQRRIILDPADSKNRRGADQPIPAVLAYALRPWLRGKPAGRSVFPLHHETAKMIRKDLEAAGVPYETEEGCADFHSLRGYYISALVRSGARVKTVQTLARHSNPSLTLARYAKVDLRDIAGAVDSLADPFPTSPDSEPMAATGTDPGPIAGSVLAVNRGREQSPADVYRLWVLWTGT